MSDRMHKRMEGPSEHNDLSIFITVNALLTNLCAQPCSRACFSEKATGFKENLQGTSPNNEVKP